jgi:hypothetical protein
MKRVTLRGWVWIAGAVFSLSVWCLFLVFVRYRW